MTTDVVVLGEFSGVFGVKGWVKIRSYTRPEVQILTYRDILVGDDGQWSSFSVAAVSGSHKYLKMSLHSIVSRESADQLVGKKISVQRNYLKPPKKDEYYWLDLIGLKVVNLSGHEFGIINALHETGANDVLEVIGDSLVLIPYVLDIYIKDVDLVKQKMIVDWEVDNG
jgi:16S rRNA processing protein RimM